MARKEQYLLYLTTNRQFDEINLSETRLISWLRMLLGVDIPNIQQIVMVRPPNMEHAVVQVCTVLKSKCPVLTNFEQKRDLTM